MTDARHDHRPATRSTRAQLVPLLALALLATVVALVSTAQGIGVTTDGVAYLSVAQGMADGEGLYQVPDFTGPTHYPPGYPVLVGGLAWLTGSAASAAARVLMVLTVPAVILLAGAAVRRRSERFDPAPLAIAALAACSLQLYFLSIRALSEPVFLVLVITALLVAEAWLRRPSALGFAAMCVASTLALTTRYLGAAVLVALAVVVLARRPPVGRIARLAVLGGTALLPMVAWYAQAPPGDSLVDTHATAPHHGGWAEIRESIEEAGGWVFGAGGSGPAFVLLGAAVLAAPALAVAAAVRAERARGRSGVAARARVVVERLGLLPWLAFLVAYPPLTAAHELWIGQPVLSRYWAPYVLVGLVVIVRCTRDVLDARAAPGHRTLHLAAIAVVLVAMLVPNAARTLRATTENRVEGVSMNELRYQRSRLWAAAAQADVVQTDFPPLVTFHLRDAYVERLHLGDTSCLPDDRIVAQPRRPRPAGTEIAVLLVAACDTEARATRIAELLGDGYVVEQEPDVGRLIRRRP